MNTGCDLYHCVLRHLLKIKQTLLEVRMKKRKANFPSFKKIYIYLSGRENKDGVREEEERERKREFAIHWLIPQMVPTVKSRLG